MYAGKNLAYNPRINAAFMRSSELYRGDQLYTVENDHDMLLLKRNLEQHFRPVFQGFVYGGEQMANHDLKRLLMNDRYKKLIPEDKLYEVMDLVDFNPGRAMTYEAFVRIVTGDRAFSESILGSVDGAKPRSQVGDDERGVLNTLCQNTAPQIELDEFLPEYHCCPPPFFVILITVVQICVFIAYAVDLKDKGVHTTALDGVPTYSPLFYDQGKREEVWRFFTYMFLHQGVVDLIFNIILQLLFGFPLEIIFYFWRIVTVYFCGVITGSLLQSVSDHCYGLVGASGGIYAVLTAHIMGTIFNWSELNKKDRQSGWKRYLCNVPLRIFIIVVLMACQVGLALYRRFNADDIVKTGIGAYAGGILAGLLLGKPFMKDRRRYPWQANAGWLDLFIFVAFVGGCIVFNVAYKAYPPDYCKT